MRWSGLMKFIPDKATIGLSGDVVDKLTISPILFRLVSKFCQAMAQVGHTFSKW